MDSFNNIPLVKHYLNYYDYTSGDQNRIRDCLHIPSLLDIISVILSSLPLGYWVHTMNLLPKKSNVPAVFPSAQYIQSYQWLLVTFRDIEKIQRDMGPIPPYSHLKLLHIKQTFERYWATCIAGTSTGIGTSLGFYLTGISLAAFVFEWYWEVRSTHIHMPA